MMTHKSTINRKTHAFLVRHNIVAQIVYFIILYQIIFSSVLLLPAFFDVFTFRVFVWSSYGLLSSFLAFIKLILKSIPEDSHNSLAYKKLPINKKINPFLANLFHAIFCFSEKRSKSRELKASSSKLITNYRKNYFEIVANWNFVISQSSIKNSPEFWRWWRKAGSSAPTAIATATSACKAKLSCRICNLIIFHMIAAFTYIITSVLQANVNLADRTTVLPIRMKMQHPFDVRYIYRSC